MAIKRIGALLIAAVLALASPALAVTAVIQWNPNPELTIVKYRVYRDNGSPCSANSPLLSEVLAPNTQYVDAGITQTQYYCIAAVDIGGRESVASSTVTAQYPTISVGGECAQ